MPRITDTSGYGRSKPQRGFKPQAPRVGGTNYSALENYKARRHQKQMFQAQQEENEANRRREYLKSVATPDVMPPDFQRKYDELRTKMYEDAENDISEEELIRQMAELNAMNQAGKTIVQQDKDLRTKEYNGEVYLTEGYGNLWEDKGDDFDWRERALDYRDGMFKESAAVPNIDVISENTQGFIDNLMKGDENIEVGRVIANGLIEYNKTREVDPNLKEALIGQIYTADPATVRYYQKRYGDGAFSKFTEDILPRLNTKESEAFASRFSTPRGDGNDDKEPEFLPPSPRMVDSESDIEGIEYQSVGVDIPRGMKINVDIDGITTSGELSRVRYDKDGKEVADITYSINTGGVDERTGKPRTQLKTETMPLLDAISSIKSTGNKKQYDAVVERVDELRKNKSSVNAIYDVDVLMNASNVSDEYSDGKYKGKNKGSVGLIKVLELNGIKPTDIDYDPSYTTDDLSFKVNGVTYSYNFGNDSDKEKFKKDLKNKFSSEQSEEKKSVDDLINETLEEG